MTHDQRAGGAPIFPEFAGAGLAKDRIVDPVEVARRDPQVVVRQEGESGGVRQMRAILKMLG